MEHEMCEFHHSWYIYFEDLKFESYLEDNAAYC